MFGLFHALEIYVGLCILTLGAVCFFSYLGCMLGNTENGLNSFVGVEQELWVNQFLWCQCVTFFLIVVSHIRGFVTKLF